METLNIKHYDHYPEEGVRYPVMLRRPDKRSRIIYIHEYSFQHFTFLGYTRKIKDFPAIKKPIVKFRDDETEYEI